MFGPGPSADSRGLAASLWERAATVPHLRSRLAQPGFGLGTPWVEDSYFDPALHVRHWQLAPPPAGKTWRPRRRPDGRTAGTRSADVGVACPRRSRRRTNRGRREDPPRPRRRAARDRAGSGPRRPPRRRRATCAAGPAGSPADEEATGGLAGLFHPLTRLLDPEVPPTGSPAAEVAGETVRVATGVVKTLPSPPSSLNVAVGPTRRFVMHQLDLDDLHLVRKQHGATVNDVVLAVVTGGLRSWMTAHGGLPDKPVRVLFPISLPQAWMNGPGSGGMSSRPCARSRPRGQRTALQTDPIAPSEVPVDRMFGCVTAVPPRPY